VTEKRAKRRRKNKAVSIGYRQEYEKPCQKERTKSEYRRGAGALNGGGRAPRSPEGGEQRRNGLEPEKKSTESEWQRKILRKARYESKGDMIGRGPRCWATGEGRKKTHLSKKN